MALKKPQNTTVKRGQKNTAKQNLRLAPTDVRRALLNAAKKLFAKKGLGGTSIRDIATEANVNSSMISYYFSGKEGLYKDCLREIGESRLSFAKEILKPTGDRAEFKIKLKMFIENMFSLYLEDRDAGLIIVREYDRQNSPAEKVFRETFLKMFELLEVFFKKAQSSGVISKSKDPFILSSLFFGSLSSQMRLDHIKEKAFARSLKNKKEQQKVTEHIIELFLAPKSK